MGKEIERKYLVNLKEWTSLKKPAGMHYKQGYLCIAPEMSIRIRITESQAFITIKGKLNGATRTEYEYDIPMEDAKQMIRDLVTGTISKIRYKIYFENKLWEVDQFLEKNDGLLLAEIELKDEEEEFAIPGWIGREVTNDDRYYNANLVANPYEKWKEQETIE